MYNLGGRHLMGSSSSSWLSLRWLDAVLSPPPQICWTNDNKRVITVHAAKGRCELATRCRARDTRGRWVDAAGWFSGFIIKLRKGAGFLSVIIGWRRKREPSAGSTDV